MKKTEAWAAQHNALLLLVSTCVCGILGGGFYLLAVKLGIVAPAVDVLLCCIGYPALIIGFLGSLFVLYRNGD